MGKCDKKFVETGGKTLACGKDGKHIVHKDGDGTAFVKAPGGAIVNDRKK